ncbi:recombinase family protein [Comamonas kerstersii]|uniref:recombinase family protein n=1 Tax=Comamonas kerstersii TaxID=225992 RepID=UPI001B337186|nr:recombinase family protein [Comamonas kerstersii]
MGESNKGLVYSYLRFSDPKQSAGGSTDRQLAYAAQWAAEHGLALDTRLSLRDEGLSAYHQQHIKTGALGVFLRAVEDGRVPSGSVLIVEGLDRLSRAEPLQAQAQLGQIVNAGITVVTASDGKTYSRARLKENPMDLVYSLLVMIRAHEESDTKSKRVKASIRRLCEKWLDGTYRGRINQGHDPLWLRETENGWEFNQEQAKAVLRTVELYKQGWGGLRIAAQLDSEGLSLHRDQSNNSSQRIYKLIKMPQLAGHKPVKVEDTEYLLRNYYPGLLTEAEYEDLQRIANDNGRRRIKGDLPHIITGIGICVCGYCGKPMAGQNLATKPRLPDGRIRDGYRRLLCASAASYGEGCSVPGSCSVAPIERAIMNYCSDLANLQSLYGPDRTAGPRRRVKEAADTVAAIRSQLDQLANAMLQTGAESVPMIFLRKARELEQQLADAERHKESMERDLVAISHANHKNAHQEWRALSEGVEAQDTATRLKARQLVADTFERITVYHHGIRPAPHNFDKNDCIDVVLVAKGGTSRLLHIDKTGNWIASEDLYPITNCINNN